MAKRLIIVRHGNTFLPEQTPTRVGRGTDLELVEEKRGRAVGKYLLSQGIAVDRAYAAPLKRTMQTAKLVLEELRSNLDVIEENRFLEIDYGVDENKTEEEVILRLGQDYALTHNLVYQTDEEILSVGRSIIAEWDKNGTIPNGWSVDIASIKQAWINFANTIQDGETVLLCSSNGIIRFAPSILSVGYEQFCKDHTIKVATGSVSIFEYKNNEWTCLEWNSKAYNLV